MYVAVVSYEISGCNIFSFHGQNGNQSASASKESTPGPCDTETVLTAIREKRLVFYAQVNVNASLHVCSSESVNLLIMEHIVRRY